MASKALITCLLLAVSGLAQTPAADDAAIRQLVQKYMDARNTADAAATRSLFTDDADQLVSTGEWRKGIDALMRGMMASSHKENGKSTIPVESIRFLDHNAAIADGRYVTTTAGKTRDMWTTLIVKRTPSGWRIAAIRNMLPSR